YASGLEPTLSAVLRLSPNSKHRCGLIDVQRVLPRSRARPRRSGWMREDEPLIGQADGDEHDAQTDHGERPPETAGAEEIVEEHLDDREEHQGCRGEARLPRAAHNAVGQEG